MFLSARDVLEQFCLHFQISRYFQLRTFYAFTLGQESTRTKFVAFIIT